MESELYFCGEMQKYEIFVNVFIYGLNFSLSKNIYTFMRDIVNEKTRPYKDSFLN